MKSLTTSMIPCWPQVFLVLLYIRWITHLKHILNECGLCFFGIILKWHVPYWCSRWLCMRRKQKKIQLEQDLIFLQNIFWTFFWQNVCTDSTFPRSLQPRFQWLLSVKSMVPFRSSDRRHQKIKFRFFWKDTRD